MTYVHLMEKVLHEGGVRLCGGQTQHVHNSNGLHVHDFAVQLHALEDAVEHLRQAGLGRGLVHRGAAHQEYVVAGPHSQQQGLHQHVQNVTDTRK